MNIYGAGLNKNEGSNSSKNLFPNPVIGGGVGILNGPSGSNSGLLSKKQDLNNLKQQINMVSNFAKNLQFQSKLKKPTSLMNRNEQQPQPLRDLGGVKKSLIPSPS